MTAPSDSELAVTSRVPQDAGRLGRVLTGGGARGAYQVGVLKAIAELLPRDAPIPFRVISGTSAGAMIAAVLAAHARHYREGVINLERFWRNFRVEQVFRVDAQSMLRSGLHWLLALVSGGWLVPPPRSLFDNTPLRELLERHVNFARIRDALEHGHLEALAINASSYRRALTVAFYACADERQAAWRHAWRRGEPAELCLDHLMASAAVPFLFPPVMMNGEYFGDGAMRQTAPLSPAINLGADRLLIIGVRPDLADTEPLESTVTDTAPTFGQIFGFMLDTLFVDGLHSDLERLERDNRLIAVTGQQTEGLRRVRTLMICPKEDFGAIASRHAADMPKTLRTLLRTMGAANPGGRTLLSYLLFEGGYTRELIALGYADATREREQIQAFMRNEL